MSRQVESPTACSINKIQAQGDDRANDKNARKQNEGRKHFLHKVDLQGDESHKSNPQPLPDFFLTEYLTDLHLDGPPSRHAKLDAIRRPEDAGAG